MDEELHNHFKILENKKEEHPMKYVYLAGPIAGCDKSEANDWREYVSKKLKMHGLVGVSPLRCEPATGGRYDMGTGREDLKFGSPSAINGKNQYDTNNCNFTLAYLPKFMNDQRPSIGTIFEIAWAIRDNKPVVIVSDDEYYKMHPLIMDNVHWILDDLDEAVEVLAGILQVYNGE